MYHVHDTKMNSHEEEHYLLARSLDSKRRSLFRAKLYAALSTVRDARDSCIVYSSFPLHDLGRMLMEEDIPFRFIHNESTSEDLEEASHGGVILLGPRIPLRFDISADTIVSLDTFMSKADSGRLLKLAKEYFILISIPKAGKESTLDAKSKLSLQAK